MQTSLAPRVAALHLQERLVLVIAAVAAATLLWWPHSEWSRILVRDSFASSWPRLVLFGVDWMLMCAVMMLPTALPLTAAMGRLAGPSRDRRSLVVLCAAAFMSTWALTGIAAQCLQWMAFSAWDEAEWVRRGARIWVGGLLLVAGAYLCSPWAQRCADICRSPLALIQGRWRPHQHGRKGSALRIGLAYGASCVGCCWPLMLAMAVLALSHPLWLLAGTLMMFLQKYTLWGQRLAQVLGIAMALFAVAVALEAVDLRTVAPSWAPQAWLGCTVR